jgi:ankyrin repeat protein
MGGGASAQAVTLLAAISCLAVIGLRGQELSRAQILAEVPIAPLTAAIWNEDSARVKALLDSGADSNTPADGQSTTPWTWAVIAGHRESLGLMRRTAKVQPKTERVMWMALQRDDVDLVTRFLASGLDVEFRADGYTPLMAASASGYVDMMRRLLEHGAQVNSRDQFDDTALMAAVRSGRPEAVRLLIDRGATVSVRDNSQRSAVTWALREGRSDLVRLLGGTGTSPDSPPEPSVTRRPAPGSRAAIARALPLLQRSASVWNERRDCASCHHQGVIVQVTSLARRHGFTIDAALAVAQDQRLAAEFLPVEAEMRKSAATSEGVMRYSMRLAGTAPFAMAWFLAAHAQALAPTNSAYEVGAELLGRMQMPDGRWRVTAPRVPIESSDIKATAAAVRALTAYAPRNDETKARLERAGQWLLVARATTLDDLAYRLLGLQWSGTRGRPLRAARDALAGEQRPDGGWAQRQWMNTDAYATALALIALHDGGAMPPSADVYQRGVGYLLRTQHSDGSWFVPKRAPSFNRYFESGFPYGKHQFISFAATGFATIALLHEAAAAAPAADVP